MTDAKNRVTSYTYDARGRQLTATYADGRVTSKTYDGMGSVLTQTDEDGKVTAFGYDAAGQLTRVTNALGQITQYGYDAAGNKISQTDARNSVTTYQWDALNRRTRRTLPLGQFEAFGYDAVGNQMSRTDLNGRTTAFLNDSLNRQLRRTPDASFAAAPVQYTYTATGKRLSMNDVTGATTYSYDNRDRLLVKATPQGSLTYTHDRNNMVASVLSSNTGGVSVSYGYDLANRLTTVTDNFTGGGATTYTYEATNVPQRVAYPNGVRHMFGYDQRDRQTSVSIENGASVLASWAYTSGPAGHRLTSLENNGRNVSYAYDSAYKLTNETIAGDPLSVNGLLSYMHDAVGNRLALASTLAALGSQAKSYDANDRLTDETYDTNGSTLAANGWTYGYEFEDRLVSATKAGVSVTMQYDGDGNRVVRTEGASTVRYLVDDLTPTGYVQVAEEVAAGSVARVYVHGPQRVSQRELVGGAWTFSYYGYDESMGSVRPLTDAGGSVTDRYSYDGFGNVVARTGSTANAYLYRGEQFDTMLETYYLRARWYRADRGGFLSQDKYEANGWVDSCCQNAYLYVSGNPIAKADPSGLVEHAIIYPFSTFGAAVAGGVSAAVDVCFLGYAASSLAIAVANIDMDVLDVHLHFCFLSATYQKRIDWRNPADRVPPRNPPPAPRPPRDPSPPGRCPAWRRDQLQGQIQSLCRPFGGYACGGGDSCAVASVKLGIASGCLAARMAMAFECYDMNPNPTPTNNFDPHTEALTSAAGAVGKCVGCVVTKCF